ncbi:hypothetical protein B0H17DRAFT_1106910, partial [Mycena rosella]
MSSRLVAHSCQLNGKCVSPPYYQEWSMCCARADTLTAQWKAQAEIVKVVGMGHLPDFGKEAMPYVSELVNELMRWWTVTPLGAYPIYRSLA